MHLICSVVFISVQVREGAVFSIFADHLIRSLFYIGLYLIWLLRGRIRLASTYILFFFKFMLQMGRRPIGKPVPGGLLRAKAELSQEWEGLHEKV